VVASRSCLFPWSQAALPDQDLCHDIFTFIKRLPRYMYRRFALQPPANPPARSLFLVAASPDFLVTVDTRDDPSRWPHLHAARQRDPFQSHDEARLIPQLFPWTTSESSCLQTTRKPRGWMSPAEATWKAQRRAPGIDCPANSRHCQMLPEAGVAILQAPNTFFTGTTTASFRERIAPHGRIDLIMHVRSPEWA
jgi:hypothetical protein